ncbi:MAG: CRISPR-associated endonuclease Cas2 [Shewanella sp.]
MASHYVIAYDICDPRRLRQVHKLLLANAIALQFSVFYARLEPEQLELLVAKLRERIAPRVDKLSLYRVVEFDLSQWDKVNALLIEQQVLVM